MHPRLLLDRAREALADTPSVMIVGPRQCGKSTLAQMLAPQHLQVTLDDALVRSAAQRDPAGWLAALDRPVLIDEVQKAPELLDAIKARIDRARRPGEFVLTGSADVLVLPAISESLAGRVEVLTLWPLSQRELAGVGRPGRVVRGLFGDEWPGLPAVLPDASDWRARALAGGFPEAVGRARATRRSAWFESYLTSVLARDVLDVADLAGVTTLPRLLRLLASRDGATLNVADLSRTLDVPQTTLRRHLGVLEAVYLVRPLEPWHANLGKRLVKAPKLHLVDTGLLAHLLGVTTDAPTEHDGRLFESLVLGELVRQGSALERPYRPHHFRAHDGHEVDLVLEDPAGRVVGVEIKATRSPASSDFKGLRLLQERLGPRFVRGVVVHGGSDVVRVDPQLRGLPFASLLV